VYQRKLCLLARRRKSCSLVFNMGLDEFLFWTRLCNDSWTVLNTTLER